MNKSTESNPSRLKNSDVFTELNLATSTGRCRDFESQRIAMYAVNPGPANTIIPFAEKLANRGAHVTLKLNEPALSLAKRYFSTRITPKARRDENISTAITCGHINVENVTTDMRRIKKLNPNAHLVTMDDNLDMTLPIIQRLLDLHMPPSISFLMNPLSKTFVQKNIQTRA